MPNWHISFAPFGVLLGRVEDEEEGVLENGKTDLQSHLVISSVQAPLFFPRLWEFSL